MIAQCFILLRNTQILLKIANGKRPTGRCNFFNTKFSLNSRNAIIFLLFRYLLSAKLNAVICILVYLCICSTFKIFSSILNSPLFTLHPNSHPLIFHFPLGTGNFFYGANKFALPIQHSTFGTPYLPFFLLPPSIFP